MDYNTLTLDMETWAYVEDQIVDNILQDDPQNQSKTHNTIIRDEDTKEDHVVNVQDAYFAKRKPRMKTEKKEGSHTVANGGTIESVKNLDKYKGKKNLVATHGTGVDPAKLKKGDVINLTWDEEVQDKDSKGNLLWNYEKVSTLKLKQKIYVVVECAGDKGKVTVKLHESKLIYDELVFTDPVKFMIDKETKTEIVFDIKKTDTKYTQEIILRPQVKTELKTIEDNLDKRTDKKSYVYISTQLTETAEGDEIRFRGNKDQDNPFKFLSENKESHLEVEKSCFCDCDFIVEDLVELGVSKAKADTYINAINDTLNTFKINKCIRKTHFLAQIFHECGFLTLLTEQKSKHASSGSPYKGRGILQVTGQDAYEAYGKYVSEDFTSTEDNRNKLALPPHNVKSSGWFWTEYKKLNSKADDNDFINLTNRINGGNVGYDDRYNKLKTCFEKIYDKCLVKDSAKTTTYNFSDSASYNNKMYAYAWGLWHDSGGGRSSDGCTSDSEKAIAGYERANTLLSDSDKDFYGINKNSVYSDLVYYDEGDKETKEKPHVKVKDAIEQRLKALKK